MGRKLPVVLDRFRPKAATHQWLNPARSHYLKVSKVMEATHADLESPEGWRDKH